MNGGWEMAVVGLLVAGAGAWAVRALVRSLRKPGGCSSCGSSGDCPLVKLPEAGDHAGGADAAGCGCAGGEQERRRGGVALH